MMGHLGVKLGIWHQLKEDRDLELEQVTLLRFQQEIMVLLLQPTQKNGILEQLSLHPVHGLVAQLYQQIVIDLRLLEQQQQVL